jgi:hypothetical protein
MERSLLCHLCGKTSSTSFQDQASHRTEENLTLDEYLLSRDQQESAFPYNSTMIQEYQLGTRLDATKCPPLWWIVIQDSSSRSYWNRIASVLSTVLSNLPPYLHVALLVASSRQTSVWNLTSPIPWVQHYATGLLPTQVPMADVGTYFSHIQTALRALADQAGVAGQGLPMTQLVSLVLQQVQDATTMNDDNDGSDDKQCYAGGRLLVLMHSSPEELQPTHDPQPSLTGKGGIGGACFETTRRWETTISTSDTAEINGGNSDIEAGFANYNNNNNKSTKSHQKNATHPIDDWNSTGADKTLLKTWSQLGQDLAQAAIGLDILVVTEKEQPPVIGLPLLLPLVLPTGAPGPVIVSTTQELNDEIWSRRPICMGGLLRLRLSPGFQVDTTPLQHSKKKKQVLAPYYAQEKGLFGPGSYAGPNLWHLAACDASQSVTVDLAVTNKLQRYVFVEGLGEVALKPCLQVSFAYTTIVLDNTTSQYQAVRRLRVSTLAMPLASSTESLYASLDTEALAMSLFHKLYLSVLMDGLKVTQEVGQSWLLFLLASVYQSAEAALPLYEARQEQGLTPSEDVDFSMFYPHHRLLDDQEEENGDMQQDVILAQGHPLLKHVLLLAWCLLQSDGLRPSSDHYRPSWDARCAALWQMSRMTPSHLMRCMAPRVELWTADGECLGRVEELSLESIRMQLQQQEPTEPNLVLLVDAPFGILVCNGRQIVYKNGGSTAVVGQVLEQTIQQARESYRTPPPVIYALDPSIPPIELQDYLVQDSIMTHSSQTFEQWKKDVAAAVYDELDEGD